jgi:catechol 2,3-dioxygenase
MPTTLPAAATETPAPAHPAVRIGHVHLKVADLDRALGFWRDVIGLEEQQRRIGPDGRGAVFLSAGGYHHHIALNNGRAPAAHPRPRAPRGSTTSPCSTRTAGRWRRRRAG